MAGTQEGGLKASKKIKQRYGKDYYTQMGKIGGMKSRTGGFASTTVGSDGLTGRERASLSGAIGGKISRRNKRI